MHDGPNLKKRVKVRSGGRGVDDTAIKRAELALSELSINFDSWAEEEVERLASARDAVAEHGYSGDFAEDLFRASHDLKGEAVTFGYPMVTQISASLCSLLDAIGPDDDLPGPLISHHVDAMRAIIRGRIKGDEDPVAAALFKDLAAVTQAYIDARLKSERKSPVPAAG